MAGFGPTPPSFSPCHSPSLFLSPSLFISRFASIQLEMRASILRLAYGVNWRDDRDHRFHVRRRERESGGRGRAGPEVSRALPEYRLKIIAPVADFDKSSSVEKASLFRSRWTSFSFFFTRESFLYERSDKASCVCHVCNGHGEGDWCFW